MSAETREVTKAELAIALARDNLLPTRARAHGTEDGWSMEGGWWWVTGDQFGDADAAACASHLFTSPCGRVPVSLGLGMRTTKSGKGRIGFRIATDCHFSPRDLKISN